MTRLLTAVVLLAVLLPVTLFAPARGFGLLMALVLLCAAWEWGRLMRLPSGGAVAYALLAGVALLLSGAALSPLPLAVSAGWYKASALFWVLVVPFAFVRRPALAAGAWRVFLLAAGIVVLLAAWYALFEARLRGVSFVLSLMLVVWLADIGAYFTGRRFGRRKLAPAISPGKTWEGVLGGWVLVLLVALVACLSGILAPTLFSVYGASLGLVRMLLWLTVLVAFSVIGDLFESLLKRQAGVKDSSALLPGHGGVLDRIDALLPTLPLAMLMLR